MSKRKKEPKEALEIPYAPYPTTVKNNGFWHQWCCDCNLRHTYFFRVIRGKKPKDDKIEMFIERDDWATLAAKHLNIK